MPAIRPGVIAVLILARLFPAGVERLEGVSRHVAVERARLGPWTSAQVSTVVAFVITVAMWVVPGVRETRTYTVMEAVKAETGLPV